MKISDVLNLAGAGFSRDEIMKLAAAESGQAAADPAEGAAVPAPAADPEVQPDPVPVPEPVPAPDPEPEPEEKGLDPAAVMAELLGLKNAIQANNINSTQMPTQLSAEEQADAALANIINPNRGG